LRSALMRLFIFFVLYHNSLFRQRPNIFDGIERAFF
jgi:hypothetical protein